MCSWSLDMLSQPQETLELQNKQSKQIAVTQLAFPSGDVNNFVVGSEDGTVYSGKFNKIFNLLPLPNTYKKSAHPRRNEFPWVFESISGT